MPTDVVSIFHDFQLKIFPTFFSNSIIDSKLFEIKCRFQVRIMIIWIILYDVLLWFTSIRYAKNQQTFKPHTNRIQLLFNLLTSVSHNFSLTRIHNVTRQSRTIQKKSKNRWKISIKFKFPVNKLITVCRKMLSLRS